MIPCKNCQQTNTIKHGFVRDTQRYTCHACDDTFVRGDERHTPETALKTAVSVRLYSLGKASCGLRAKRFDVSRTTTAYWMRDMAATTEEPALAGESHEIAVEAMWHFVPSQQRSSGSSTPWIMAQGALVPGYSVVVMVQRFSACMTHSTS